MEYYRKLPHFQPLEAAYFITMRLYGSMPQHLIELLKEEQEVARNRLQTLDDTESDLYQQQKRYFARFDSFLDRPDNGPYWLSEPAIAEIMKEALHHRAGKEYDLIAFCLMSNHIHLVIHTYENTKADFFLYRMLQAFKSYTARKANDYLEREGPFWHPESYDHIVRNGDELKRIIAYTLNNPVKAGLVANWQDWPHSYVNEAYW
ncbi:transposase [Larkinella sp. VNQ87]|uniref:transposase n=1 Tax=Larkinella sp. VNQ87 TaxID=3400921 RepID=UPI003C01A8AB